MTDYKTTAVFVQTITNYTLSVTHEGGEGYINVWYTDENGDRIEKKITSPGTFTVEVKEGDFIRLFFNPDDQWEASESDTDFYISQDRSFSCEFTEYDTGYPFNIPESYWNNVLQSDVKEFLQDPEGNDQPNNGVVIGFSGTFNDRCIGSWSHSDAERYAGYVAEVIKYDAKVHNDPTVCIINAHWGGWMQLAETATVDEIKNQVDQCSG